MHNCRFFELRWKKPMKMMNSIIMTGFGRISAACGCHTGRRRKNNEDNFFFAGRYMASDNNGLGSILEKSFSLKKDRFFAVFDGMGGGEYRTEGKANTGAEPAVLEGAYPDEKELKAIRKSLNICTVVMGVCTLGIGLLWCIPIRKKILNRIDRREPVSNGLKIAATWVGMIPGLLLLVNEDI